MKFEDLTDEQLKKLEDLAFDDWNVGSSFCESYGDFYLWLAEKGIHHDYACDNEIDYLEENKDEFLKFAFKTLQFKLNREDKIK